MHRLSVNEFMHCTCDDGDAAIAILFAKSRVTAILLNGVLGYSIAIVLCYFPCTRFGITQIVVETVTTALFLLCFYFLTGMEKGEVGSLIKSCEWNYCDFCWCCCYGYCTYPFKGINYLIRFQFILKMLMNLAGGKNIVNTILGDFRAFDTMLEVVVLFIAGIGVYTLIKLKARKGERDVENK